MWNLLALGASSVRYKPTASSGTITNPTYAYDADESPWATYANVSYTGSSVAGTPDNNIVDFTTFGTLNKANFSSLTLSYVYDFTITPAWASGVSGYVVTANFDILYSTDGGTTWTTGQDFKITYSNNGLYYASLYPATDISATGSGIGTALTSSLVKVESSVILPSSAFSSGLQDLQIRFISSTLESVRAGSPSSTCSYKVWDIRAEVS